MARGHGRILTSIWEDPDFLALDERAQRLYLFLISQPNLNHAGLLDLTLRRWARKARGLTVAELEKRIADLEDARFVVVDEDTEELLIRSFVRNDGVWRMPKVMGAMVSGALEMTSRRLQRALLAEMDRVPLEELSSEPTKLRNGGQGPSIRQQVADCINTLRKAFGSPDDDPSGRGSATPSGPPSVTPSETLPEGGPRPSTRGRAGTSRAPSPSPAPTPTPHPIPRGVGSGGDLTYAPGSESSRPEGRAPIDDAGFELTDGMRRWAEQTYPRVDVDYATNLFITHFRGEGVNRPNWYAEWQKWITRENKYISERGTPSNVVQLPTGQTLTGSDANFAGHAALTAQLRAQEDQERTS
ncbi:hypothetical protein [Streptomyces phytophilus]|uniref:hypothetical protein n=1 Tax=Streptomyces phytophilus TaxID=722715 RepID=UPI0015F10FD3|nr:hypothetical protein [Streptomyces phytophilus]